MERLKLALVFVLLFAGLSFGREMNVNMKVDVSGMEQAAGMQEEQAPVEKKKSEKHSNDGLKTLKAVMGEDGIELSDGRVIPVTYSKAMFPYPQIEVLEPAGAKVSINYDEDSVFNGEIPFIWKDAGIDEYVKMTVTEDDAVWSIKFQAKKGKELRIGNKGAEPAERSHHGHDYGTRSKHFSVASKYPRSGEAFVIKFFDFPSRGMDWMTIVPEGSPDTEWGQWQYTNGPSGEYTVPTLQPGRYEIRAYYDHPNGGFVVRDRLTVIVK